MECFKLVNEAVKINGLTSNENSPGRLYEGAASCHSHQVSQHGVGYLIGVVVLMSVVELHQT